MSGSRSSLPSVVLGTLLLIVFLNLAVSAAIYGEGLALDGDLATELLFGLVAVTTLFAGIGLLVGWPLRRYSRMNFVEVVAAVLAAVAVVGVFAPLIDLGFRDQPLFGKVLALIGALLVAIAVASCRLVGMRLLADPRTDRAVDRITTAAPLIGLTSVVVATILGSIDVFDDATGMPSWPALLTVVGFGLGLAATLKLAGLARRRFSPSSLLAFQLLVLSLPVALAMAPDTDPGHRAATDRAAPSGAPDVVLVTVDTLRADAVGAYRDGPSETPHIDGLAEDSLVFLDARSPAPWTKPAVASILTGLSPLIHGANDSGVELSPRVTTLAEHLRSLGYATAATGSNPHLGPDSGFPQGFDDYRFFTADYITGSPTLGRQLLRWWQSEDERVTRRATDRAIQWLESGDDAPSFLWLHLLDPHSPYAPTRAWSPAAPPPTGFSRAFDAFDAIRNGEKHDAEERSWIRDLYDAEVQFVDAQIGRLLQALRNAGRYRNSLIVLTSDHGEEFWEHGSVFHGHTLYDELLRVPLIVKLPYERATGTRRERAVTTASIAPTVLELLGHADEVSTTFSARPLTDHRQGPVVSVGRNAFDDRIAIVADGYKYIRSRIAGREELYRLSDDPAELWSLARTRPARLGMLREMLARVVRDRRALGEELGLESAARPQLSGSDLRELEALGYLR